jgi:hypothetical protein
VLSFGAVALSALAGIVKVKMAAAVTAPKSVFFTVCLPLFRNLGLLRSRRLLRPADANRACSMALNRLGLLLRVGGEDGEDDDAAVARSTPHFHVWPLAPRPIGMNLD